MTAGTVLHTATMPELPGWEFVSLAETGDEFLFDERSDGGLVPGERIDYEPETSPGGAFKFLRKVVRLPDRCEGCGDEFADEDSFVRHLPTARRVG